MTLRRFNDDINGTFDANGNVSIPWVGMTGQFSSLLLIAQAKGGSPSWTVKVNGSPVNVGRGINSPLRLPLLHPNEGVVLVGTGGQPSTAVTGHFVGYAADSPYELPLAPPEPSTISLDTASPAPVLGSLSVPTGTTQAKDFSVPAGINVIGYSARNLQPSTSIPPQNVQITGKQSGIKYINATLTGILDPIDMVILTPVDTAVTLSVTTDPAALVQSTVDLIAWTQPTMPPRLQPRPWEVPLQKATLTAQSIAAGGTVNLIPAGSFSQGIYLHGYSFMHDGSNAQGRFTLFEAFGPTIVHEMWGGAVRGVLDEGSFRGWRMPNAFVGVSLQNNSAAAEFLGGFLEYSYGP